MQKLNQNIQGTDFSNSAVKAEIFYKLSTEMSLGLYIYHLENFKDAETLRMIWANPRSEDFTSLKPEEIVGKTFKEIFPNSNLGQEFVTSIRENRSIDFGRIQHQFLHKTEPDFFEVKCFPVDQEYCTVVFENITDRVRQELQFDQQKAIAMNASRLAALGEMSGGIAHEVNNPLAIIQGFASQLRRKAENNALEREDVIRMSEVIHKTTERIAKIVRGLRNFAREGSNDPVAPTSVQLIINDAIGLCGERFRNHQVDLRVPKIDPNLIVDCRSVELGQVLINLLNNAFDAVKKIEKSDKWIAVEVENDDQNLTISILDNGPGIPEEIIDSVMQPFFTTKEVGKGTGLGLSISKGIIEKHSGKFTIDRNYTDGASFVICLPLKQSGAERECDE